MCICVIHLDATVSFDKSTFSVHEQNKLAQPILVLSNQASYNITVTVRTFDVSATGELFTLMYTYVSNKYVSDLRSTCSFHACLLKCKVI